MKVMHSSFITYKNLEMHGGFICPADKGEELDDTQFIVYAPDNNVVKVTAHANGNVGLIALSYCGAFPLRCIEDVIAYQEPQENDCTMLVDSPGPSGFVVYVMSNGQ